jgi:hypothetical protein
MNAGSLLVGMAAKAHDIQTFRRPVVIQSECDNARARVNQILILY